MLFTFGMDAPPLSSSDESLIVITLATVEHNWCDCDGWESERCIEDALRINAIELWGTAMAVDCDC